MMAVTPCGQQMLSFLSAEAGHMADKSDNLPDTLLRRGKAGYRPVPMLTVAVFVSLRLLPRDIE
jgi:hypothetical protein